MPSYPENIHNLIPEIHGYYFIWQKKKENLRRWLRIWGCRGYTQWYRQTLNVIKCFLIRGKYRKICHRQKRERQGDHRNRDWSGMWPKAKTFQQLEEESKNSSSEPPEEVLPCLHLDFANWNWFQTPGLQNCDRMHSCCLKASSLG